MSNRAELALVVQAIQSGVTGCYVWDEQRREQRRHYSHRDYWYAAVIPESGFKHGLFVEMELIDDDPELPVVALLNAHPELK